MKFDLKKYKLLKSAYAKALKDGRNSIIFEGQELVVSYTKYLLEHLENELKIRKK